jgi:UDP-N-acetylmuramyl pentapeptide phosphotransferase/UDP-N-acetylglucosamine-1-phosphate transferase
MDFSTLNWIAIIVSALVFFGLGAVWYNPAVFGTMWMQETGNTKEKAKSANMPKMMGLTMLFSFVMALNLALFMNSPEIGASQGAMYGFFTGLGWISMSIFISGQYEFRSTRYMLINSGYYVVGLTLMGVILGAWK